MGLVEIFGVIIGSLKPDMFIVLAVGTVLGYFVGAMPGIGSSVGVALMIPFTYVMRPELALLLMVTMFMSAQYANAIPAITINTPGTTGAVATCFDGYPLAQKGRIREAISLSLNASVVGGIMGVLALIFVSVPIIRFALQFGSAEYFAVGMVGIVLVVSMKGKESVKGFVSAGFGFWLSMIGLDMLTGQIRFTFGIPHFIEGIALPPVFIGLLAFPEIIKGIENWKYMTEQTKPGEEVVRIDGEQEEDDIFVPFVKTLKYKWSLLRSGIVGTVIGAIPGTGASIANLLAYEVEKKCSSYPEKFGTGVPEGIIAAETANNAVVGSSLIPLLTLGIPGSNTGAILLMVLMMHGVVPGPQLFTHSASLVYVLYGGLFMAIFAMWIVGRFSLPYIGLFKKVPFSYIVPTVFILCFIGAYSLNLSMLDVYIAFSFGALGYFMKRWGFATAPAVLGLVLGRMIEINFRRTILSGYGTYTLFYTRPIALTVLIIIVLSLLWTIRQAVVTKKKSKQQGDKRS